MNTRLPALRQKMLTDGLDAILISQPETRLYLSAFDGSSGYLLITADRATLATDFRYTEQASSQAQDFVTFETRGPLTGWLPELVSGLSSGKLGFEANHVTFAFHRQMSEILQTAVPGLSLAPVEGMVESLRAVKDPTELRFITAAAELGDRVFEEVAAAIRPGMTEKEIAWQLESRLRQRGSERMPFDIIVASGPNAALPHHHPSDRQIQPAETIVVDMGARLGGYCSDLSRTLWLGPPDDTFARVYGTVLEAQSAAIEGIRHGMTGHEADRLARDIIQQAGYGDAFGHSLGHGVGLAAHEEPRLSPNATGALENGMVFSIEPGIYLSGWGGVRIEDLAVMDNGGPRLLSRAQKLDTSGGKGQT